MSAVMSRALADYTSTERTIDELDAAIGRLVRQMNAECYQMLVLVREFDDRFGWKKWTLQDLRRVARVAQRDRSIGGAREGAHGTRTAIVCRRSRGLLPTGGCRTARCGRSRASHRCMTKTCSWRMRSARRPRTSRSAAGRFATSRRSPSHHAQRAWGNRSLTMWRDEAARPAAADGRGADRGRRADRASARLRRGRGRGDDGPRSERSRGIQRHGLASAAGRCARRGGAVVSRRQRAWRLRAARPPIGTRSSCTPTRKPSAEGPDGRIFRSRP